MKLYDLLWWSDFPSWCEILQLDSAENWLEDKWIGKEQRLQNKNPSIRSIRSKLSILIVRNSSTEWKETCTFRRYTKYVLGK